MEQVVHTPASTASAVVALSKAAWRLGTSLSKLDRNAKTLDCDLQNLAGDVESLGNECDLIYAKLVEIANTSKTWSPPPYDGDSWIRGCLATQVEETRRTLQELELFVRNVRMEETEDPNFVHQSRSSKQPNNNKEQMEEMGTYIRRHTDNLRTILILIQMTLAHLAPHRAERPLSIEVERLQAMVKKLQRASQIGPPWQHSHTEAVLMQYAREIVVKNTPAQEASGPPGQRRGASNDNTDTAGWINALDHIRQEVPSANSSLVGFKQQSMGLGEEAHDVASSTPSSPNALQGRESSDSDDDLDTDFAKAALDTGTRAFESQDWVEADALLQEALRILQQIEKPWRACPDVFDLHYKLAICAYHTQQPTDAEGALTSLIQQSPKSNEQRCCIHDAVHLLSQLYLRIGQFERARLECEKALQARRRLLGKQSDPSLESMALMAHIYVLLDNRALAKSCLAMIPEKRRDATLRSVEKSLGIGVEHLDFASLLSRTAPVEIASLLDRSQSRLSASTLESGTEYSANEPVSSMNRSPATSRGHPHPRVPSKGTKSPSLQPIAKASASSIEQPRSWRPDEKEGFARAYFAESPDQNRPAAHPRLSPDTQHIDKDQSLSRKEILSKVGCQPRDRTEEAVCDGDFPALTQALKKKKGFWRSSVRKHGPPERVTALHFAALFGEVEMAQCLLDAGFNVNEIPFGYSTNLTPLIFAIGARQVRMVEFLTANGAKPAEPDTWSTLAAQLMSRSWLTKTMSDADRDSASGQVIAIMGNLLKHGWNVSTPIGPSGGTVLHLAVSFWTGSYQWDLCFRAAVAAFLCERGANPFQPNAEGKTPLDIASSSGQQDLILILDQQARWKQLGSGSAEPVELPGQTM